MNPLDSNTASKQDSLWKGLSEKTFRRTIADLKKVSGEIPGELRRYSLTEWERHHTDHNVTQRSLSLEDEQHLADDLAYIAASRERGKGVSAVALEEHCNSPGMTVRLAANSSIPAQVPEKLNAVFSLLHNRVERGISERSCVLSIFQLVIELDQQRIHSRLRSKHWKPSGTYRNKAPLHNDLLALLPALRRNPNTEHYREQLASLCVTYGKLDRDFASKHEELQLLQDAVKSSSAFYSATVTSTCNASPSTFMNGRVFKHRELESKHIQQVAKVGRYWDLCVFLTKVTRRYPDIFKNLRLELAPLYRRVRVPIPPTQQIEDCRVHAEIQLIIFYGLTPNLEGQMPRVLGVSKSACYLCDLFISLHGHYFVSETHGRLYDKWTVPNLANFSIAQRQQYRTILQRMNQICKSNIHETSRVARAYPAESALKLHAAPSSIAASTVANPSQLTIQGPAPSTEPQDFPINPSITAADNITEGSRTPVQTSPGSPPLPPRSEIEEDPYSDQMARDECRPILNGATSTIIETSIPSTPSIMSTINADTAELPLQGVVTQPHPYHIEVHSMGILFEIETPRRGRIAVQRGPNELVNVVDIDAMTPGRTVDFYREDGESSLKLNLRARSRDSICIELEWLPD